MKIDVNIHINITYIRINIKLFDRNWSMSMKYEFLYTGDNIYFQI
jgi:hypothetical protein